VELGQGDLAIVALHRGAPSGIEPLPLVARTVPADELLAVFGFPVGRPKGVWKRELQVAGPLAGGWQQLLGRRDHGYKLQAGFSGCPIIDPVGQVVGLCTQAERDPDVDAGAAIPVSVSASWLESTDGFLLSVREVQPAAAIGGAAAPAVVRPEVWNVPPLRNASFTGRTVELATLADALHAYRVVALTGLGGVGKTQLTVQHAHDRASHYRLVWWVVAERLETLAADLAALAERLELPEAHSGDQRAAAEAALRRLEREQAWLLVFDNVPDAQFVRPWLPEAGGPPARLPPAFHRASEHHDAILTCATTSAASCQPAPPAVAETLRLPPGTPPPCARNLRCHRDPSPHRIRRAAAAHRRRFQPLPPSPAQRRPQPRTREGPQLAADSLPSVASHRSVSHRPSLHAADPCITRRPAGSTTARRPADL
jgi:NB-ARC domain-containing protein